jgi:small subunit ribosomal protein S17
MEKRNKRKVRSGIVVSDKMQKTIVVKLSRRLRHPMYGKLMTRSSRVKVHDEKNECRINDVVEIVETRPISSQKNWRLSKVLQKAK